MSSQHREAKMRREILVVPTHKVYENHTFEGFIHAKEADLEQIILEHFEYKVRWDMEVDPSYQQPIPYAIIVNPQSNKVIAYQRWSSESTSWEQRLYGKRSLWVGGHIELEEKNAENPMHVTVVKEIKEEIWLTDIQEVTVLWYINDNSDPVGEVHLGILYLITTHAKDIEIVDGELEQVFFKSHDEIEEIMSSPDCDVESRSKIARQAYKDFQQK